MRFSKVIVEVNDNNNKTLAYLGLFTLQYRSVMFYGTGPRCT
jgi:hypothetical protein